MSTSEVTEEPHPETAEELAAVTTESVEYCRQVYAAVEYELSKVIVGQKDAIEQIMISILTKSHSLLVGVPGLAKTLLISTLADALDLSFKRIQFTPDLMPSDITGTEVIHQDPATGEKEFKFHPGPLFSNIVLADEINRTPPKTQAAMLEAMQEKCVTVGGVTRELPNPFFVLATQNPLEQEGTYPLPEAQLDRFLFLIHVGYPDQAEELEIMKRGTGKKGEKPEAVLDGGTILTLQEMVKAMPVADHVHYYALEIVRATRSKEDYAHADCAKYLSFGAGPRASLGLIMAAKAHAMLAGQVYVGCENVAAVAPSIMRHRISVNFTAQSENVTADDIITKILESVPQYEG